MERVPRPWRTLLCVSALGSLLQACAGTPDPVVGPVASAPVIAGETAFSVEQPADYRLHPTDVVNVVVYREPDLSVGPTPVGADGTIALPVLGSVPAGGMTAAELARTIEAALAGRYLTRPQVAVNVVQYNSHRVTVEGAVKKPGVFAFVPGAQLSSAIAQAEGPERTARLDQVAVFRHTDRGMMVAKFDYRAVRQGTMIDPVLQPGDRVVVGTSGLSVFWQDLLKTLPAFAVFTQL